MEELKAARAEPKACRGHRVMTVDDRGLNVGWIIVKCAGDCPTRAEAGQR